MRESGTKYFSSPTLLGQSFSDFICSIPGLDAAQVSNIGSSNKNSKAGVKHLLILLVFFFFFFVCFFFFFMYHLFSPSINCGCSLEPP